MRSWLFGLWSRVSEQFGFEMVEGPVLESEELFTRKAGEEIVDQLYNFEVRLTHSQDSHGFSVDEKHMCHSGTAPDHSIVGVVMMRSREALKCLEVSCGMLRTASVNVHPAMQDKGGRRVALRPELTPSLARLALQKGKTLPLPAKWSQVGAVWSWNGGNFKLNLSRNQRWRACASKCLHAHTADWAMLAV